MKIPDFRSTRLLVAGDMMLDRYWFGMTSRISPEAPVPVVRIDQQEERVGGAANVALNLATLGATVTLLGYCGEDEAGDALTSLLRRAGVECRCERISGQPTITKLRVISRHQQLLRLDFEEPLCSGNPDELVQHFREALPDRDVVVLSDYGKGTLHAVDRLIRLGREAGKPVLIDPKGRDFQRYRGATLVTPNLAEFEAVAGPCRDDAALVERGRRLVDELAIEALLITRGEQGMTLLERGQPALHLPTHAKEVFDVTGAGDTVVSVLAGALAAGTPLPEAAHLANLAAGIVVGKLGTSAVTAAELDDALIGQRAPRRGIVTLAELLPLVAAARRAGERIVLTNGCFDLLHPGHVRYLRQARQLGDRLIVLVNGDASVRRLKGADRPINDLAHRMALLEALECVDWVVAFDDDTPRDAICRILPDVLVKGGDYRDITAIAGHECVLANGGEVKLLDFVGGFSTSRLIDNIRGGTPS